MSLGDPAAFYDAVRHGPLLGPTLSQPEADGLAALLEACEGWPLSWTAYGLATAYHETAHTMQPIQEMGGAAYFRRMYDIEGNNPALARRLGNVQPGDGARYCGRGYVQLTGRANYARAEHELGVPLVANPAIALQAPIAAKILRRGMDEGWFSGRRLAMAIHASPAALDAFVAARGIINGEDRAELIAGYAMEFQRDLVVGQWTPIETADTPY